MTPFIGSTDAYLVRWAIDLVTRGGETVARETAVGYSPLSPAVEAVIDFCRARDCGALFARREEGAK